MQKARIIRGLAWSVLATGLLGGYVFVVVTLYHYWHHRAVLAIADTKSFHMDCTGRTFPNCDFREVPVHINNFADVVVPTILSALGILVVGLLVGAIARAMDEATDTT